jgi:LmbE family N-acetylglucosaminyl deacetylase
VSPVTTVALACAVAVRHPRPGRHTTRPGLGRRLLVVSPHCDDAVLSLGAALTAHVRTGGTVTVLTLLAGDPAADPALLGPWDRAAGFADAGSAARARREEDRRACAAIGASHVHLTEVDQQYARRGSMGKLVGELTALLPVVDTVLLPGHPLRHPDHRFVHDTVLPAVRTLVPTRLYAEEPYAAGAPEPVDGSWSRLPASARDLLHKARALRCYESQLPLLGAHLPGADPARALVRDVLRRARTRGELVSGVLPGRPAVLPGGPTT